MKKDVFILVISIILLQPGLVLAKHHHSKMWYRATIEINHTNARCDFMAPLIAKEIFAPAMSIYASDIKLWHFRKNFNYTGSCYQFSFIFFAKPKKAKKIFNCIQRNSVLRRIKQTGMIADFYENTGIEEPADIAGVIWNKEIRKLWPYYAMNTSNTWLKLVFSLSKHCREQNMILRYKIIQKKIKILWERQINSAFTEQLNNIFGRQNFCHKLD